MATKKNSKNHVLSKKPTGTVFVLFGITGDLASKYLIPAIYNLALRGIGADPLYIIGFARREWSDDFLRNYIKEVLTKRFKNLDQSIVDTLLSRTTYVKGDFNAPDDYTALAKHIQRLEKTYRKPLNKMHYLAVPPNYYADIFNNLGASGLAKEKPSSYSRILIEKPFGSDLKSAASLNKVLLRNFKEDQIYRIDHYLAKEPVQNILAFRFGNGIFENLWNAKYIDNIQVSAVMEDIGIETRGNFYEQTGALLDAIQNHVLQLVALICMDQPKSFTAEAVRDEKYKVLKKIAIDTSKGSVIRGQYTAGEVNGTKVPGYRQENQVDPNSHVETFTSLKLAINNPTWKGVPVYVRTGKRVDRKYTEISIEFKQPSVKFLGHPKHGLQANVLTLRIQPEESIILQLMVKKPDFETQLDPVQMDFCYNTYYKNPTPEAYERIIYDAMLGTQFLFVRSDSVLEQWKIIDHIHNNWKKYPLAFYAAGTMGPESQNTMLKRDKRAWWNNTESYCPVPRPEHKEK